MNKSIITARGKITVHTSIERAFDFFADPANDGLWRSEINRSISGGPVQVGVKVTEYSYLSKKAPNNLVQLTCVAFEKNRAATFETPAGSPFYEKSQREVRALAGNSTEITYAIEFDINIVKFALGFSLPRFIIALKAQNDMKKYLRQLKQNLENR